MRRSRQLPTTSTLYTSVQCCYNSLVIILHSILHCRKVQNRSRIYTTYCIAWYYFFRFNIYGNFSQKLCLQRGASYISHRLYFRHFFTFFGKNGFRSYLTNGRTDFCPNFANFRNFSGPYDGHTYSPPKKKTRKRTDGPGSIKKTTDGHGQHLGIPWPSTWRYTCTQWSSIVVLWV